MPKSELRLIKNTREYLLQSATNLIPSSTRGIYVLYKRRGKAKAQSHHYDYVLLTDITDFYNQVYLRRLQNSIESCSNDLSEISRTIEKFLTMINNSMSKGIPVGPAASIILAEASLIDVDQFIQNNGFYFDFA